VDTIAQPGRALPHGDEQLERLLSRRYDPRIAEIPSGLEQREWSAQSRRFAAQQAAQERAEQLQWAKYLMSMYSQRSDYWAGVAEQLENGGT
jgi:hypothetical protein